MKTEQTRFDRAAVFLINVLCMLIPLLLLSAFLLLLRPANGQKQAHLLYEVTFSAVSEECLPDMIVGLPVLDSVSKREIGRVVDCQTEKATMQLYHAQSERFRQYDYPHHKKVTLTVEATGRPINGGYSLSGFTLYRGKDIPLRLPNFVGTGTCTDLKLL